MDKRSSAGSMGQCGSHTGWIFWGNHPDLGELASGWTILQLGKIASNRVWGNGLVAQAVEQVFDLIFPKLALVLYFLLICKVSDNQYRLVGDFWLFNSKFKVFRSVESTFCGTKLGSGVALWILVVTIFGTVDDDVIWCRWGVGHWELEGGYGVRI